MVIRTCKERKRGNQVLEGYGLIRVTTVAFSLVFLSSGFASKAAQKCPEGLYLPAHIPGECVSIEANISSTVEDEISPIVGTYMMHYTDLKPGHQAPLRLYADGTVVNSSTNKLKWVATNGGVEIYYFWRRWNYQYTLRPTTNLNSAVLISSELGENHSAGNFEAIRISEDPDHQFDHFVIGSNEGADYKKKFYCFNVGRKQFPYQQETSWGVDYPTSVPRFAKSAKQCASLCEKLVIDAYGSLEGRSCP